MVERLIKAVGEVVCAFEVYVGRRVGGEERRVVVRWRVGTVKEDKGF